MQYDINKAYTDQIYSGGYENNLIDEIDDTKRIVLSGKGGDRRLIVYIDDEAYTINVDTNVQQYNGYFAFVSMRHNNGGYPFSIKLADAIRRYADRYAFYFMAELSVGNFTKESLDKLYIEIRELVKNW